MTESTNLLLEEVLRELRQQRGVLSSLQQRLDSLENALGAPAYAEGEAVTDEFPPLAMPESLPPLKTTDDRRRWWNELSPAWQQAFRSGFWQKFNPTTEAPTDTDLQVLLETNTLRLVGPKGQHLNVFTALTDCSGLRYLTQLKQLFFTHHEVTTLDGLEQLTQLETLFCNSNRLANADALRYLPNLRQLYLNDNRLTTLRPLAYCPQLEVLHCNHNLLTDLHGLADRPAGVLNTLVLLPNERLPERELRRVEQKLIINIRRG